MIRRVARSAAWLAAALFCAAPLYGLFASPARIPAAITAGLVALAALALSRPRDAVLVFAAFAPIAGAVRAVLGAPLDGYLIVEASALIVLGGAAIRAAVRGSAIASTAFEWAAIAFIAIALASCAVQVPLVLIRAGEIDTTAALRDVVFRRFFTDRSPALSAVWQTMLLVEGCALAALTARTTDRPDRAARLAGIVIAGGAAAAALNVNRLLEIAARAPAFGEALLHAVRSLRFNTQYGDLNAAGSYFAMVAIICAARAGLRTLAGRVHAALLALLGCALWISGSRVALGTALIGAAALITVRWRGRMTGDLGWRAGVGAAGTLAAALVVLVFAFPQTRHATFGYSFVTRLELLKTGARMVADRPVFGVGTSQFYALYPRYTSPELQRTFQESLGAPVPRENAHNQFLQILAELGVFGLASFVALLALALWPRREADANADWRRPVAAGLAGFLVTSLAGHPLLTPLVAYPFWIVVGLCASAAPPVTGRIGPLFAPAVAVVIAVLAATLPPRIRYERRIADLTDASVGFSRWERDDSGTRFRLIERRGSFFVPAGTAVVRLPLKSPDGAARHVDILLDGRPAAGLTVPPGVWVTTHLPIPPAPDRAAFRRVDLVVDRPAPGPPGRTPAGALIVGRAEEIAR